MGEGREALEARRPCRHCLHVFRLRKDGRVPMHRPNRDTKRTWAGVYCYGAGLRPKGDR